MAETFGNSPQASLAASITAVQTTITVTNAAAPWPQTPQFRIRFASGELALVTGGAGTTTWTVQRGIEGTTPAIQPAAGPVVHVLTGGALAQLKTDAIATIVATPPIVAANGVVSITDATAAAKGAMTAAYAGLLDGAIAANTASRIVKRDSNGDFAGRLVTAARLIMTTTTVQAGAPTSFLGIGADNIVKRYNPSSLTVGSITSQANSATIAASTSVVANSIAQREANGYLYAQNFNSTAGDNSASQPYMLFGRYSAGDAFLRTYNPNNLFVGYAASAGFASTVSSATYATNATTMTNWQYRTVSFNGPYWVGAASWVWITHGAGSLPIMMSLRYATAAEGQFTMPKHPVLVVSVDGDQWGTGLTSIVCDYMDDNNVQIHNRSGAGVWVSYRLIS